MDKNKNCDVTNKNSQWTQEAAGYWDYRAIGDYHIWEKMGGVQEMGKGQLQSANDAKTGSWGKNGALYC